MNTTVILIIHSYYYQYLKLINLVTLSSLPQQNMRVLIISPFTTLDYCIFLALTVHALPLLGYFTYNRSAY